MITQHQVVWASHNPTVVSVAIAEVLLAMGSSNITANGIVQISHAFNNELMMIGEEGALGILTPAQVKHAVIEETINGPSTAWGAEAVQIPTYAEAESTVDLISHPGGLHSVFGF